jgi:hypothetical protein
MCGASHLAANEHKGLFDSISLSNNDFRLVVDSKMILHSEGEHTTKPNSLVNRDDLFYFDDHIGFVGPIKLVELIGRVCHTNNFVGPFQLIAESNHSRNSKISLHFRKDCGIFCEGEWEQSQQLTQIIDDDSNAAISQRLVGLGQTGLFGLVGHIGSVNRNGSVDCNGLAGFIGLGLVGFIGFGLISLVSGFGLIGLGGISGLAGRISLIGSIGLIGVISFGLIALSASAVLLAHWPCYFAAATCQVGPVGCTSPNSLSPSALLA